MRAMLFGLGVGLGLAVLAGGGAAGDPLDAYRWRARVLVISAPDPADDRLRTQRAALAAARGGADERDLVVLEALGEGAEAAALRRRLTLPANRFRAVLVGKDGGTKLASDAPIPSQKLFATIDAMPMRRDAMRR